MTESANPASNASSSEISASGSSETPSAAPLTGSAKVQATLAKLGLEAGAKMTDHVAREETPLATNDDRMSVTSEDESIGVSSEGDGLEDIQVGSANNIPQVDEDSIAKSRELRRQHLLIQKQNRAAGEQLKQVRAEQAAFQQERDRIGRIDAGLGQVEQDPTAILRAAGLDPNVYGQKLMRHFVNLDQPVDPVEQKVQETVAPYINALNQERAEIQRQQLAITESNVMVSQVRPMFTNPETVDKFETLLGVHNGDVNQATLQVYNTVKSIYLETGVTHSFAEVAEGLENQYFEQMDLSLKRASNMKKYRERFRETGLNASSDSQSNKKVTVQGAQSKNQSQAKTLTNNNNASSINSRNIIKAPTMSDHPIGQYEVSAPLDRVAATLAKHGLDANGRKRVNVK